jgi:hypothetical protein
VRSHRLFGADRRLCRIIAARQSLIASRLYAVPPLIDCGAWKVASQASLEQAAALRPNA